MSGRLRPSLFLFLAKLRRSLPGNRRARKATRSRLSPFQQRRRIAITALLIGLVAGAIELPMPAEDAFKAVRAELRLHPVPGDIVVIEIDNKTLADLAVELPDRTQDAALVDTVFAQGANRLVFDRAYADPATPDEDAAFAAALERHQGKVWLGALPAASNMMQDFKAIQPIPALRDKALLASMLGQSGPFGLSIRAPTSSTVQGNSVPSIATVLAEHDGDEGWFRPDLAYDAKTIPTVSYSDVLSGQVGELIEGKNLVVSETHLQSPDYRYLPLGDRVPGVYLHVLAAYTLQEGLPIDLFWIPALLIVAGVLVYQARRKRPLRTLTWSTIALLPLGAMALEYVHVNVDVLPALIALVVGVVRLHLLANRLYSRSTNLVLREALQDAPSPGPSDVYALKITNLGDFDGSASPRQLGDLVERVVDSLQGLAISGASHTQVAFEKDTLIWQAPALPRADLVQNGEGLMALLRSGRSGRSDLRIEGTLAIEANQTLELQARIHNAMQAAEMGSRHRLKTIMADAGWLKDRARHLSLLAELDVAMKNDTIGVGYQPKIDLASGSLVGAEALLRWDHSELGYIAPPEIVGLAEEHDRIGELTVYVLDRAMREAAPILAIAPEFKLAVNVSATTLANEMFVYHVARLRHRHRFPGRNLVIEVTETAPLGDDGVQAVMRALCQDGVTFSIDDFGTGHANLAHLGRVPSVELKIDRSFVCDLLTSADSEAVVRGTIDMAHSLGKTVVAEGIETEVVADRLRKLGCDVGQGFLFSPAIPIEQIEHFAAKGRFAA